MTKKVSQLTSLTTPDDADEIIVNDTSTGITKRMTRSAFFGGLVPPGVIASYISTSAPTGWLLCDGSAVNRSTYAALFAVIGTAFGNGDGSTTFNLPSALGKIPVGYDGGQTEFNAIAKTGGEKTHTMTTNEMPNHNHIQDSHGHGVSDPGHGHSVPNNWMQDAGGSGNQGTNTPGNRFIQGLQSITVNGSGTGVSVQGTTATNQAAGGGAAHNNLQPYFVIAYIIKT